jgi:hypothetical protein
MIQLISDDIAITVLEDNPIYKTLKKFHGESFMVYITPKLKSKEIYQAEEKKQILPKKTFNRENIIKEFDDIFIKEEDLKKIPIYLKILRSDLESVLGGEKGEVLFEVEKEGIYKRNGKYLIFNVS